MTPPYIGVETEEILSLSAGSLEEPQVLRTYTSCGSEHMNYCSNGGKCIYPQDTEKLACM